MTDEEELRAAQLRVWSAANRHDLEALHELLSADFLFVEADTWRRHSKDEFLRELEQRGAADEPVSFQLREVRVQQGGDLGVVYAQFHCTEEVDGEPATLRGNTVDIFARTAAGWRLRGSVYGEVAPGSE